VTVHIVLSDVLEIAKAVPQIAMTTAAAMVAVIHAYKLVKREIPKPAPVRKHK
jgi:hypothetical protein